MADDVSGQSADSGRVPPRWTFAASRRRKADFVEKYWPLGLALAALDLGAFLIQRLIDGRINPWVALPLGIVLVGAALVGIVTWEPDVESWLVPLVAYWAAHIPLRDSTVMPWPVSEILLPGLVFFAVYYGRRAWRSRRRD